MSGMNTSSEPLNFQGISERLKGSISGLVESSKRLQKAIISRNVNDVWMILEHQQRQMQEFDRYNYIWKQTVVDTGLSSPAIDKVKDEIAVELTKLQKASGSNASLLRSYLAVIGRVFKHTASEVSNKVKTYGKRGRMDYKSSSMLVNRIG